MGTTKQIPRAQWKEYFERFTRQYLTSETPDTVTIEVVSPLLGDQVEIETARLLGFSHDPKSDAFEVLMEEVDHLAFHPEEIWVIEEDGGLLSTIELVSADGTKELIHVHRSGPAAGGYDQPAPPQA